MKDFYTVIPFVIAYIENENGDVLMGEHSDLPHKPYPLHWDMPGGKIDTGETVEEALIREVNEETGFDVEEFEHIGIFHNTGDETRDGKRLPGIGICYRVKVTGEFNPTEMNTMQFIKRDKIKHLKLTPWSKYFLLR